MTTPSSRNSITAATAGRDLLLIPLALVCFTLLPAPNAFAVTPAPDGGYPGANTAEGTSALFSRTTGVWDTALGYQALFHDTTGHSNTAVGLRSLFSNTTGTQNTATGVLSLFSNTTASFNTADGYQALLSDTTGEKNVATGYQALNSNTTGANNTAVGAATLTNSVDGDDNTAVGGGTGPNVIHGSNNTYLGDFVGTLAPDESNTIRIGDLSNGNGSGSLACFIGGIFNNFQPVGGAIVQVTLDLGTDELGWDVGASSARFKDEIKPMDKASESILALKPVTFRYKKEIDRTGIPRFGLVAEEVEKVNPDLVTRDRDGKLFTVRYDAVNAMLLNEFLKEHQKVQKLEAALKAVNKRLKAQDAKIDKVNAKVELSGPGLRTVLNKK
jgi:hypothetical protein